MTLTRSVMMSYWAVTDDFVLVARQKFRRWGTWTQILSTDADFLTSRQSPNLSSTHHITRGFICAIVIFLPLALRLYAHNYSLTVLFLYKQSLTTLQAQNALCHHCAGKSSPSLEYLLVLLFALHPCISGFPLLCSSSLQRTFGKPQWEYLRSKLESWRKNLELVHESLSTMSLAS